MDVVHDRVSIIEEEEEDRISNLPDEIIHRILSFLDMKFVIQTSTLSKKWKHIWTLMPDLKLNSQRFRTLPQFSKFVKHVLSHRNHRTEVSEVDLTFTGAPNHFVVRSIIKYAYSHNVRQLTMIWLTGKHIEFPQSLFRSHTLKHLTLAAKAVKAIYDIRRCLPTYVWDFPALETLNLSNLLLSDLGDKSLNLFSKCVNLKDLTFHKCSMFGANIFSVCAPRLSNLTITDPQGFPKVFRVIAPQLENLTASVKDNYSRFLQLSVEDLDSLEEVNLSMRPPRDPLKMEKYAPGLQDLFQKLCSAKFLILDKGIIELLSAYLDQLSHEPCPFNNLKCLKQKDPTPTMPTQVRNYLLESSPTATFIMDLPQVALKRSRLEADMETMAKKVAKLEEEKQSMAEEKRMLQAKIEMQDGVIAEQKAMLEAMKQQLQ